VQSRDTTPRAPARRSGCWLTQAAELGVLQLHLSGGGPTVRRDFEDIVALAAKVGLWHGAGPSAGAEVNVCAGTMPATIRPSTRCRRSFP
jgi:hypothetical protein